MVPQGGAPKFGSWNGKPITYTSGSYFASQVSQINEYLKQQGLSEQNFQLYAYQVWRMAFQSTAIRAGIVDTVPARRLQGNRQRPRRGDRPA